MRETSFSLGVSCVSERRENLHTLTARDCASSSFSLAAVCADASSLLAFSKSVVAIFSRWFKS